jgi:hypothetical protein
MSNLIRRYKIHQLTPVFSEKELEIIDFVKDKISNLTELKNPNYPNFLFYSDNNGKHILQNDDENKKLWVRYGDFWEVLENKYNLNYTDIQLLIQDVVELTFKRKVYTPQPFCLPFL